MRRTLRITIVIFLLTLLLIPMQTALAATITVTGNGDGLLPALAGNGTCDLREAVEAANTNAAVDVCGSGAAGPDTIVFNLADPTVNLSTQLTLAEDLAIDGANLGSGGQVILNGTSTERFLESTTYDLELDNLTIQNFGDTTSSADLVGGAVSIIFATLTIDNVTFSGNAVANTGDVYGGAIFMAEVNAVISNSTFTNNQAISTATDEQYDAFGGAIYGQDNTLELDNVTFENNVARASANTDNDLNGNAFGGAVYAEAVTITDSAFNNNLATNGNCDETSNCSGDVGGGAVYTDAGTLTITNSSFDGNAALAGRNESGTDDGGDASGGALYIVTTSAEISGSSITNNTAGSAAGPGDAGGYAQGGGIYNTAVLTISLTTISGNTVGEYPIMSGSGGGLYNDGPGVEISDSTFSNNISADDGGGIFNNSTINSIERTTITGNQALDDDGGGIVNEFEINLISYSIISNNTANGDGGGIYNPTDIYTIEFTTISGNTATGSGGGIFNDDFLDLIDSSTISGNTAVNGGGIYNSDDLLTIVNSTISGNTATGTGGGLYNDYFIEYLLHVTISGNTGVGLYSTGTDAIFAMAFTLIGDHATGDCAGGGTVANLDSNLYADGSCLNDTTLAALIPGTHYDTTLANNGGPTLTHALFVVAGNPAIDPTSVSSVTDDQRLVSALDVGGIGAASANRDVGAYEAGYLPVLATFVCDGFNLVATVTQGNLDVRVDVRSPDAIQYSNTFVALPDSDTYPGADYGTWTNIRVTDGPGIVWYYDDVTCTAPAGGGGGGGGANNQTGGIAVADPALTKSGTPENATVGERVTWTIIVRNTGTTQQDNVVILDSVPTQFDIVSATATQGTVDVNGQNITANLGTLLGGGTATITINTIANDSALPGQVCNTAYWGTTPAADCVTIFPDGLPPTGGPSPLVAMLRTIAPLLALLGLAGVGAAALMRRRSQS